MKKLSLTLILLSMFFVGGVFAVEETTDCGIVVGKNIDEEKKGYEDLHKIYHKFMPIEAFYQVLINMKAHCCRKGIIECTKAEKDSLPEKYYPESPFLFDHLVDVSMRRLDGIAELAYGLEPDAIGKERRKYITENVANAPNGVKPSDIEKKYKAYRERTPINMETQNDINATLTKYDTLKLIDRYDTLCEITNNMYEKIKTTDRIIIGGKSDAKSFFSKCENLVSNRVKKENGYVKILMIQKANKLADETTKAYTKKHFVEEKLMNLRNIISKVKDLFKTIVQQAPASKSCSK